MEFVGKTVKKSFEGFGVFTGTVQSYDASSGFFVIEYQDGDCEELDFCELAALLKERETGAGDALSLDASYKMGRLGRKPKKRRRVEPRRPEDDAEGEASVLDMNTSVDLNDGSVQDLSAREDVNGNLSRIVDLNESETLEGGSGAGGFDLNLNLNEGFDLNDEGGNVVNSDAIQGYLGTERKMECIDLNLDVNGELDEVLKERGESQKRECGFDLNMGIADDEEESIKEVGGHEVKEEGTTCQKAVEVAVATRQDEEVSNHVCNGALDVGLSSVLTGGLGEGIHEEGLVVGEIRDSDNGKYSIKGLADREDSVGVIDGNQCDVGNVHQGTTVGQRRRGRRRKVVDGSIPTLETPVVDANSIITSKDDCGVRNQETIGSRRRARRRKIVDNLSSPLDSMVANEANRLKEDCTMGTDGTQGDSLSAYTEVTASRRRGRRRKVMDNLNPTPGTVVLDANLVQDDSTIGIDRNQGDRGSTYKEVYGSVRKKREIPENISYIPEMTVLRRSSRRGSAKHNISSTAVSGLVNDLSGSPAVSALTEEKPVKSPCEWPEEPVPLPPKVLLPPSSQNLDLVGIPVLDLFSIYSCLRSFSTLLFLSPFELEEFVTALKCDSPSTLFDCIHVSILQTLRKHLEYLSNEGSESAFNCLRNLNWDLLDLITWPIFMVEYLLLHGSEMKLGFDLSRLKLFKSDYYKQPVLVKVEILRCLCDDMIEVDAIRSEINRRLMGVESDLEFDRNAYIGTYKKRRAPGDVSGGSCLTEEVPDDSTDWNSDECCLCKMDGNLICCDGCPAAYHSKCVGVANSSLPEGDWYCPECVIDRHKPWMKPRKSVRGAELLAVDPYGRLYFSSCGYLLVSDSCDSEFFNYYHRNDLNVVIEVLKSSGRLYDRILEAIRRHWDIPSVLYGTGGNLDSLSHSMCLDNTGALASSETCAAKNETGDGQKPEEQFTTRCSARIDVEMSKSVSPTCMSSEGSAETIQMSSAIQNFQREGPDCFNRPADCSNEFGTLEKPPPIGNNSLISNTVGVKQENNRIFLPVDLVAASRNPVHGDLIQLQPRTEYMNYYSFGHTASSIAEVLMCKSSDKIMVDSTKSYEELMSAQMKVISKKAIKFRWPNTPSLNADAQKEMCGWCFSCRFPTDDSDCLVNMSLGPGLEGSLSEAVGLQPKRTRKGYLTDIIRHILLIEDKLQGLLLGPWLNPHHSRVWRKNVLIAADIESVKRSVLMLESNMHQLALSADWLKHVDSAVTMGSASHIVTSSLRASSKNGVSRKRVKASEFESNPSSNSASGLSMLWRRGGKLSRQLFSWKVLPHSLVMKAARQAGCAKIPGILYPENSDFAKRSKYVIWRAAVEASTTPEQLALQVRELDSNIRWNEIENTYPLPMLDKDFRKSIRLFKKVIVRRKCVEAGGAKYLLDFGKRRSIPEVVLKNGLLVEEPSSERKKYWLNESHVPLHILKSFEEKRIARKSGNMGTGKLSEMSAGVTKPLKKQGFSYLFAKAERCEYHTCRHCNKDVPIREAVCCEHCKGFFHKRHVRKSTGSLVGECLYTCHRCKDGKYLRSDGETGKSISRKGMNIKKNKMVQLQRSEKDSAGCKSPRLKKSKKVLRSSRPLRSQNKKKAVVVPLRRSPRKIKHKALQSKKVAGRKKRKQVKSTKGSYKKVTEEKSWHKKRTQTHHSHWVNGLQLSGKPADERVMLFRGKRLVRPFDSVILVQPKCLLCCEERYTPTLNYISCELCGDWFHGDAFGLDSENVGKLIGFRCHVCRDTTPPVCPCVTKLQNDVGIVLSERVTETVPHDKETILIDQSGHTEEQLDMDLLANYKCASESHMQAENGH